MSLPGESLGERAWRIGCFFIGHLRYSVILNEGEHIGDKCARCGQWIRTASTRANKL